MLFYMRRNYKAQKFFTIKNLAKDLNKPVGSISRDLSKMESDGIILKKYIAIDYINGERLQIYLTELGLILSSKLLFKWLRKTEQKLLKKSMQT